MKKYYVVAVDEEVGQVVPERAVPIYEAWQFIPMMRDEVLMEDKGDYGWNAYRECLMELADRAKVPE